MGKDLLQLYLVLTLTGPFGDLGVRFQYTAGFLCHLIEWYL